MNFLEELPCVTFIYETQDSFRTHREIKWAEVPPVFERRVGSTPGRDEAVGVAQLVEGERVCQVRFNQSCAITSIVTL